MRLACLWMAGLLLVACGASEPRPVPIAWNEDICSHCRMAISQPELAAEAVGTAGRVEMFDDIGCLVEWLREPDAPEGLTPFVTDRPTGEWLRADEAVFVQSPELPTPMGYGLAAFADREAARSLARELGGSLLSWHEVRARGDR